MFRTLLKKSFFCCVTLISCTIILASCGSTKENESTIQTTSQVETTTKEVESTTMKPEETTEVVTEAPTEAADLHKGELISPLTGLYVKEKIALTRPVCVMLNNIVDAVPQASITRADIVYECPVEGGITRLMAIYQDYAGLDKIGSVRSCRLYYAHIAVEYDAVYVHFGQAKNAIPFLDSNEIDNINLLYRTHLSYRTSDRVAPHNAYIDTDGIIKGLKECGYESTVSKEYEGPFVFASDSYTLKGSNATYIEIPYPHNNPYFKYNKSTGLYDRYQFGEAQQDELTKKGIAYKNVIIQYVDGSYVDGTKTWDLDMVGSGSGYYLCDGNAVEISWSRSSLDAQTVYTTKDGKELLLNPGKTWVCVVKESDAKKVIIK